AHDLREQAVQKLGSADRQFLFEHAVAMVDQFSPQRSGMDEKTMAQIEADRRFGLLVSEQLEFGAMIAAAQVLMQLGDEQWLARLAASLDQVGRRALPLRGVTGEIVVARETPLGLVIIGGPGPNTYELDQRVALIIDL